MRGNIVSAALFLVILLPVLTFSQTATQPSGSGTVGDPYLIASLENLYWLTQSDTAWDAVYLQTADIDASSSSGWDSNQGFTPIGNGSTGFTGTYDGNYHTVTGVFINRDATSYVGFFGRSNSPAVIKNLGLVDADITVTGSGSTATGGLIGSARYCTIRYCFITGTVTGYNYVGGFVAHTTSATISDCYSTADVTGYFEVGGFIGYLSNNSIDRCYSVGAVTLLSGGSVIGGFMSLLNSGSSSNCFWDTQTSGQSTSAAGTGKTTTQMKTLSTFTDAGWDFEAESDNGDNDYWDMDTSDQTFNDGYPFLSWQNGEDTELPVQMTGLVAEVEEGTVRLQWTTVTEADNSGWSVERREISDFARPTERSFGRGFRISEWKSVGFVEGAGTSASPKEYSFVDRLQSAERGAPSDGYQLPGSGASAVSASRLAYRLKQLDRSGASSYSEEVEVSMVMTAPAAFHLSPPYPNPFNPSATIEFTLAEDGPAQVKVIDLLGREVARLFDGGAPAGMVHRVTFDGTAHATGVYFVRLQSGGRHILKRIQLVK